MKKLNKRYIIKIPLSISVFYCDKKDILLVKGVLGYRVLHLKTKITVSTTEKLIKVTNKSVSQISINAKKK